MDSKNLFISIAIVFSGAMISVAIVLHALIGGGYVNLSKFPISGKGIVKDAGNTQPDSGAQNAPTAKVNVSEDNDPSIGDKNAKVVIIEFSDFQCPFCKRLFDDTFKKLKQEYIDTGKVRLVYRDYPLSFHANSQVAAEASGCANDQGKFWEMHDKLFENQDAWSSLPNDGAKEKFGEFATQIGLDVNSFTSCVNSEKYKDEIQKDIDDGTKAGVSGTPTLFINGSIIVGAQPYSTFKSAIDQELKNAK